MPENYATAVMRAMQGSPVILVAVGTLDLLGIASGGRVFHRERNAHYVTAFYRAHAHHGEIKLSREHADGRFFAPDAPLDPSSVSVQYLLELLLS